MIPPDGSFPAPRGPRTPHGLLLTSLTMLVREVVFGFVLWASAAPGRDTRLALSLVSLCAILLWTRRFGILGSTRWLAASWEGLLVYVGAVCMCNILSLVLGTAPWWH